MSAKDLFLDFINYLFIILLVVLCFFYFIDPERFREFTELMRALMPLAFLGIVFLIKLKFSRMELNEKKDEGANELLLSLAYFDKVKADLMIFGVPMIMIFLKLIMAGTVEMFDIIIASMVLAALYFWHRYLFSKARN